MSKLKQLGLVAFGFGLALVMAATPIKDLILQSDMDAAGFDIDDAGAVSVADDAYAAGWDSSTEVPTKNAVYDKIETVGGDPETDPVFVAATGSTLTAAIIIADTSVVSHVIATTIDATTVDATAIAATVGLSGPSVYADSLTDLSGLGYIDVNDHLYSGSGTEDIGSSITPFNAVHATTFYGSAINGDGGDVTMQSNLRTMGGFDIGALGTAFNAIYVDNVYANFIGNNGMEIQISDTIRPDVDGTLDIGTAAESWANLYVSMVEAPSGLTLNFNAGGTEAQITGGGGGGLFFYSPAAAMQFQDDAEFNGDTTFWTNATLEVDATTGKQVVNYQTMTNYVAENGGGGGLSWYEGDVDGTNTIYTEVDGTNYHLNLSPTGVLGGLNDISDLSDVDTSGATVGDLLEYDGTNWVAAASGGSSASDEYLYARHTGTDMSIAYNTSTKLDFTSVGAASDNMSFDTSTDTFEPSVPPGVTNLYVAHIAMRQTTTESSYRATLSVGGSEGGTVGSTQQMIWGETDAYGGFNVSLSFGCASGSTDSVTFDFIHFESGSVDYDNINVFIQKVGVIE